MELRIFTEPQQGATYDQQLAAARCAEDAGYGAYFRSDHLLRIGGGDGHPGPTDSWITLGALARETSTIRLGTLLTAATFRHPGPLAIQVAQVDAMSGGRVEFGIGAGWFADEHAAYGIPFPPVAERFERLDEQLAVLTGLWTTPAGETFDFGGTYYQLSGAPALPKPAQSPRPPVLIGGMGAKRTPALAVRYADEFNVPFRGVADCAGQFDRVRKACVDAGREPSTLRFSNALTVCVGRDDAEVRRRADAIGQSVDDLRANGLAGTPAEVVERINAYREIGSSRLYCQVLDLDDLAHIEFIAAEVVPQL
jgi:F420-dependent oxidoreductase-like protein